MSVCPLYFALIVASNDRTTLNELEARLVYYIYVTFC